MANPSSSKTGLWRRTAVLALLTFLLTPLMLPALSAAPGSRNKRPGSISRAPRISARPTIPTANRAAGNRVILEKADLLNKTELDSFMIVSGSVHFSKGPMQMFCDSAHYYPESSTFNAYGNVRMEQGDTLFVYADELNYDGPSEIAYLYGYDPARPVRLINRDVKLETNVFTYDLLLDLGYYNSGGVLTDRRNRLTSVEGEYTPSTKEANFYDGVHLTSLSEKDTLDIYTDTLYYNTGTHEAEFFSPTRIINGDGTILSTSGTYNTNTSYAELFDHSLVRTHRGTTLEGDTLYYDRKTGIGHAYGNMALIDSARQSTLKGDYGFYDEFIDSAFVTGRALAMEYSRGDTLYMHGKYITSVVRTDTISVMRDSVSTLVPDTTHIVNAWPRVRFYRSDLQGICDSMAFVERDSNLYMHRHPVVWNENQQVFGNLIIVHLNDSTVDKAVLPDFAFSAQNIETEYYNQLSGKAMECFFENGKMRQLDVNGSVEAIFFPEENDSTINKMVNVESSFLRAWMRDNNIERLKLWPSSQGAATPLYLARHSQIFLPKFEWFGDLRPTSPEDIFIVPAAMDELMEKAPAGSGTFSAEVPKQLKPKKAPAAAPKDPEEKSDGGTLKDTGNDSATEKDESAEAVSDHQ